MRIAVTGAQDLYRFAAALHDAGRKDLKAQLDRASREAGKVLVDEVEKSMDQYIPKNFERRWDQGFDTRVEVRLVSGRRITVTFWAQGKRERRDIKAINAGNLKHPIYGRMRRLKAGGKYVRPGNEGRVVGDHYLNPWVSSRPQRIRPGLVDEPVSRAMPKAIKKIDDAVARVVSKIDKAG